MKLIIIRGAPGTGKTLVSNILEQILPNSKVVHVDEFKVKATRQGKSIEESQKIAYEKTLEKLRELYHQNLTYIILEELIYQRDFLNELQRFLYKTKDKAFWFRLLRPLNKLLEVESKRKREIKNSEEDLSKLKQSIELLEIKGEYRIKNDNLALVIKKILNTIL